MSRVLVISNRLPITVRPSAAGLSVERSSGGLATGLKSVHENGDGEWIGWPGFPGEIQDVDAHSLPARFAALRVVPVTLSASDIERYYESYCNGVIWPLFHSFPSQLPLEVTEHALYADINARFADTVAARYREGDVIWVHDYQLMLLPRMLRDRLPNAAIGYFLHIPFPPSDTFRTLPSRDALLDGMLASDLIGFHTAAYMRNFASSVMRVLGATTNIDTITWKGRATNVGVFPMGVDARAYDVLSELPEVAALTKEFRGERDQRLLVGIDRLDYTKGIPRRLLAYERLLLDHPELVGKVCLVQVAVPSRTNVDAYAEFRNSVDALVGRINGRFGSPSWSPVHYVYRNLTERDVVALYRAANALLVTPIRDGMNLVAKEFVAARSDGDGVLVLSEFAGAAAELAEAIQVNPYDIEGSAQAYYRALAMPEVERRARMTALRRRVFKYDVHRWSGAFLAALQKASSTADHRPLAYSDDATLSAVRQQLCESRPIVLLLDYDGTLVPFATTPDLARPDAEILLLLEELAKLPNVDVHVVSGRGRDILEEWLGALPIHLHAEHGHWSRAPGEAWSSRELPPDLWRAPALEIMDDFAERTPGSLVEEKRSGIAWHYRAADPEFGPLQANELKMHLSTLLSNAPVELLDGDKVVELRPHGAHKGRVASTVARGAPPGSLLVAFGDDRTDEDLFAALPPPAITIHIGPAPSCARLRIESTADVRALLRAVLKAANADR